MISDNQDIFFSIIIPTRNRPGLFLLALKSAVEQNFSLKEIIVVNDGSTEPFVQEYMEIERQYPEVSFQYLVHRPNGHGQSYSMNYGASKASGRYLCFLDDDDNWTDEHYLQKAHDTIVASSATTDLLYSNQKAYFSNGKRQIEPVWLEDLIPVAPSRGHMVGDAYPVDAKFLLESKGFAHLNCSIFRRGLYESIGGMDEGIRYECDRDVYLRAVDAAQVILFRPDYMSYHNIPDAKKKDNMSTLISVFEKRLFQLQVYEKGILLSKKGELIEFCRRAKVYELKHVARALEANGDYSKALYYARESLLIGFNFKWFGYVCYLCFKSLFGGK